ncbi:MAG: hypothetical protein JWM71_2208 [Solirubrobacteraceae bacterium]|nr:hypothetical protein [Solirubrobacteraceae bacterium]
MALASAGVQLGILGVSAIDQPISAVRAGLCIALLLGSAWFATRMRRIAQDGRVLQARQTNLFIAAGVVQVIVVTMLSGFGNEIEAMLLWILLAAAVHTAQGLALATTAATALTVAALAAQGSLHTWFAGQAMLWAGLGALAFLLLTTLRRQRAEEIRQRMVLEGRANTDPLTGLANRRGFEEAALREMARAERSGEPVSLVFVDVDEFKSINDRLGHLEGDRCLMGVASAMRTIGRAPDMCFRWGGDEFVILLPNANAMGAGEVVGRLRAEIDASVRAADGTPVVVTAAATQLQPGTTIDEAIDAADRALMDMKREAASQRFERRGQPR